MATYVQYPSSPAMIARCKAIQEAARPGSRAQNAVRKDFARIVEEDHLEMIDRNVDRYGRPRAALAESTLKNKRRGPGPSLAPRGRLSRFAANVETVWQTSQGVAVLVKRFRDVLDRKGRPFAQYHLDGATKPGTAWVLPRRDVGGVTPRGWARLRERFLQFVQKDLVAMGGGR
jgi:hypothetical protein